MDSDVTSWRRVPICIGPRVGSLFCALGSPEMTVPSGVHLPAPDTWWCALHTCRGDTAFDLLS